MRTKGQKIFITLVLSIKKTSNKEEQFTSLSTEAVLLAHKEKKH